MELLRPNDEDSLSMNVADIIVVNNTIDNLYYDNTQDVSTTKAFVSCETDIMCPILILYIISNRIT